MIMKTKRNKSKLIDQFTEILYIYHKNSADKVDKSYKKSNINIIIICLIFDIIHKFIETVT